MFKRIVCTLLGVLCVASCTTSNLSVSEEHNRISVQLYSVRDDAANNFQGTLVELSELGIDGVEFAGDYGEYENNPEGLRAFLTQIGLKVSGAHVSFNMLKGDRFSETVNFHKKLGTPYLIVPWDERAFSPKHIDELVNDLNQISLKLAGTGIKVGYHNHAQEIAEFSNSTFWDYIAQNTNSDVVLQLDVALGAMRAVLRQRLVRRRAEQLLVELHHDAVVDHGQARRRLQLAVVGEARREEHDVVDVPLALALAAVFNRFAAAATGIVGNCRGGCVGDCRELSGTVGNCRELSGTVGNCRELSGTVCS